MKETRTLLLIGVAALLLVFAACGDDEPPAEPALDEAALSQLVQQAVAAAVPDQPEQPPPVSAQEIQEMVQAAIAASAPEGTSADEMRSMVEQAVAAAVAAAAPQGASPEAIRSMVEQAVTASTQPGVTRADIEGIVANVVGEAVSEQQPGLSSEDVQKIVSQAIAAIPTPAPEPTPMAEPVAMAGPAIYKMGVFEEPITRNFWNYYGGPGGSVWTQYVLVGHTGALYGYSAQRFDWVPGLAADFPTPLAKETVDGTEYWDGNRANEDRDHVERRRRARR